MMQYVLTLDDVSLERIEEVGGKSASLGEMIRELAESGVRVPGGFALTTDAYRLHLAEAGLEDAIEQRLRDLDVRDVAALSRCGRDIRTRILSSPLPAVVREQLFEAYRELGERGRDRGQGSPEPASVAVRVNPNVDAHTHAKITTGTYENKFGIALEQVEGVYARAQSLKHLRLRGVQMHIGSQLTGVGPFAAAVEKVAPLAKRLSLR